VVLFKACSHANYPVTQDNWYSDNLVLITTGVKTSQYPFLRTDQGTFILYSLADLLNQTLSRLYGLLKLTI